MNDSPTSNTSSQHSADSTGEGQQTTELSTKDSQQESAESTEANPLKRYQDLVNSPTTPDGHKVVAAVAAASTVTVAAVANWIMKATKK
jgi:hypothetical protein